MFEHHGKIRKVVVTSAKAGQEMSRYGFVHFAERQTLEASLAKPQADQKSSWVANQHKSVAPHLGYDMVGAIEVGYGAAGFAQPLMYGPGPTPPGMTMMSMVLPHGRIEYVL
ncbi:hypothetical protein VNO80_14248 [Phaseolus coccineus]|uniref:RRM domain-containing protein n=1 Tax=Phaseolus coccineus TaxID=3886 RepID=A0AAN9MMS6_PHACN